MSKQSIVVANLIAAFAGVSLLAPSAYAASGKRMMDGPPAETLVVADVGLHVINIGITRLVNRHLAWGASAGLHGVWSQTINFFGVSGDARHVDVLGGVLRGRLLWYPGEKFAGLWLGPFAQAGAARIGDDRTSDTHIGAVYSFGAVVGYSWWLGDDYRWQLAAGIGAQFHGATGEPGYARPYPHIDAMISYRL